MTTFAELKKRVFVGFPRTDGEALLAVEMGINDALHILATEKDFHELMVTEEEDAVTVAEQKVYHLIDDLVLTRPKKIYTIRLMDDTQSRRLKYIVPGDLDKELPYTDTLSPGRPTHYTDRGENEIELIRTPAALYYLYIRYSQWPERLVEDDDEPLILNMDTAIVFLAKSIANAYLSGKYEDFNALARQVLSSGTKEERRRPDCIRVAKPFNGGSATPPPNDYWLDPFYKG